MNNNVTRLVVFDSAEWSKKGDSDNNDQFYKVATLLRLRKDKDNEWIVDVVFNDGKISNGHFLSTVTYISNI
jgi:hypothetical protein